MKAVFVLDPLDRLDAAIDTSVGLMTAAQEYGADVWVTTGRQLSAINGQAVANAIRIRLDTTTPSEADQRQAPTAWYTAEQQEPRQCMHDMDAVFVRTEPPLDTAYMAATLILDLIDPASTSMINDPSGLRACSEHLFPLRFPDLIPPTIVTADRDIIRDFTTDHKMAILKPVDGFAGRGVLRLDTTDPNLPSILDISTARGRNLVVVQQFLPDVEGGNKRIFVMDGEPMGAVFRFPAPGDFRIGNPTREAPLTIRDLQICSSLAPELRRLGQRMVGLDIIGPYLIEVNVTSPGALRKADTLLGWSLCREVIERAFATRGGAS
ncbi:MAG: glutathione synthase [Nakamurella sp.]